MNVAIEDFKKLEIKIGKILSAEKVEGTDKLLKLEVDFGENEDLASQGETLRGSTTGVDARNIRQIVSGIAEFYAPEDLVGKLCPFIVNLEPRMLRGVESQGMILAADSGRPILLHPDQEIPPGSIIK